MQVNSSETPVLPEQNELWQQTLGWTPTANQQQRFQQLYQAIWQANQSLNLTRITEPGEFWEKHLWDSLRGIRPWLNQDQAKEQSDLSPSAPMRAIDIGTGAGFPGVPVAIVQPHWTVTLLDSTRKKVAFLETLCKTLALPNVIPVTERVEQLGRHPQHRGSYDLAMIRAVAAASVCAEYALPLLKREGVAVLYRGQWSEAETEGLQFALQQLGGKLEAIEAFTTPLSEGVRHCLYLRKVKATPSQFPRGIGVPLQKPLS
ncbi:MAG: 16S rRNA (guanine(527)-N(7))-methyltransferase RsmG [Elainellaceae cyanobacterium]